MKKWIKILFFLWIQCVVIGLSILIGWTHGQPLEAMELEFARNILDRQHYFDRSMTHENIIFLQDTVGVLQSGRSPKEIIDILNRKIDRNIHFATDWKEWESPREYIWPGGEEQFALLLQVAKHRKTHPVSYTDYPPFYEKSKASGILREVMECKTRRDSDPLKRYNKQFGPTVLVSTNGSVKEISIGY